MKKASHKHDESNPMGNNATIQKFWQKDTDAEIQGFKHILAAKLFFLIITKYDLFKLKFDSRNSTL